jgi:hypothetical protein
MEQQEAQAELPVVQQEWAVGHDATSAGLAQVHLSNLPLAQTLEHQTMPNLM